MIKDITVTILVLFLMFVALNPLKLWMVEEYEMIFIGVFALTMVVFLVIFWMNSPRDEREATHNFIAAKLSFIVTVIVLTTGIIIQMFQHTINYYLVFALVAVIVTHVTGLFISRITS